MWYIFALAVSFDSSLDSSISSDLNGMMVGFSSDVLAGTCFSFVYSTSLSFSSISFVFENTILVVMVVITVFLHIICVIHSSRLIISGVADVLISITVVGFLLEASMIVCFTSPLLSDDVDYINSR